MFTYTECKRGITLAATVAKTAANCHGTNNVAFAAISDYAELSDNDKLCVRFMLRSEGMLDQARRGLAVLIDNYSEFPLAFLEDTNNQKQDISGSTLQDLRATIHNIRDRESTAAVMAQSGIVCIFFQNEMLKVSPGISLTNLGAISDYPLTEESKKVAASVRAAVTFFLGRDISSDWRNSFWDQGRSLTPCEVG